jgi:hypothetical protein
MDDPIPMVERFRRLGKVPIERGTQPNCFGKREIRTSKSETISKLEINPKHKSEWTLFETLDFWSFDIVLNFGFRVSNLLVFLRGLCVYAKRLRFGCDGAAR